jgi:NADH dehydrogenase FAD-containing subunit
MPPKRVVIIGGGPAGMGVSNGLSGASAKGSVEVTILERKDHFDIICGTPRALVNASYADEVLLPLDRMMKGQKKPSVVAVKDITAIGEGSVSYVTPGGQTQELRADAIVIATGTSYKGSFMKNNGGLSKQAWLQKMAEWRAAAAKARHILIVGGGVTGVELAGELATEHPGCKITLVHSGQDLCSVGKGVHDSVMSGLKALPGTVEVITGDKVEVLIFYNIIIIKDSW